MPRFARPRRGLALAGALGAVVLATLAGCGDQNQGRPIPTATARDILAQLRGIPISNPEPRREPRRDPPRRASVVQASSPPPTPQPVVMAPARPDSSTIEIYRGTKSEKQKFAKDTAHKQQP